MPADGDDDTELLLSAFAPVWAVLRGLRAHDGRFADAVNRCVQIYYRLGERRVRQLGPIRFAMPSDIDEDLIQLRMVQEVGSGWERHLGVLLGWAYANPTKRIARATRHQDLAIGEWAFKQRLSYSRGVLPLDRAERLERIPGWYWDRDDALWEDTFSLLAAFTDAHGSAAENSTMPSVFTGLHSAGSPRRRLGVWLAAQRQAYRDGTLDPRRADRLTALPDWTWTPVPAEDLAMVDALRTFVDFEKHADPADGHVEDGLPLGRWVWAVRRRKLTGQLHPALEDEIWAATPSKWGSAGGRWLWRKPETQWRLAYSALRRYTEREGQASPPVTHREQLPDITVQVGQWVALQPQASIRGARPHLRGPDLHAPRMGMGRRRGR